MDSGNYGHMAFQARPNHHDQAVGWLWKENSTNHSKDWVLSL